MKKFLIKIEKLKVQPDETLIVTVGNVKENIMPSKQDLINWRDMISETFPNMKTLVVPDLVKWATLKTKPNEYVIFTIGDLKQYIFPSQKDLDNWRMLLRESFPKMNVLVTCPIIKGKVIGENKKHKVYLNNLEYLEYLDKRKGDN